MRRNGAALVLMTASGFAGLGYQIVWTQQCGVWLGHEAAAVLAVVGAFFGGLAAGSLALGGRIERSARAGLWYAGCELAVALWSVVLLGALPRWGAAMVRLVGVQPSPLWQWSITFGATFLLLLPATAAMGATLPAMARVTALRREAGHSIGGLYAANTLGAVLGVIATAFWLVPSLGFARTAMICVALNVLCGLLAAWLFRHRHPPADIGDRHGDASSRRAPLLARLALTGLLGIGYEVLVVRVLSQVTENTVYTFALLLAVYLVGTALGASLYQRAAWRRGDAALGDRLLVTVAAACLLGAATLWGAARVQVAARAALGGGAAAALLAEALLAALAFGPPTIAMGALFSHLADRAADAGIGVGRALAANTAGAALAPPLFGVLAVPAAGPEVALMGVVIGYLALSARRPVPRLETAALAAAAVGVAALAPPPTFVEVPEGGRIVARWEGVLGAVSVVEDGDGVRRLHINNRQQEGTSATLRVDGRQAWLPLLLHPAPARVLFLGLGTGITASSAALDTRIEVHAVELLPEVIAASAHFLPALSDNGAPPPLRPVAADARRFIRAGQDRYDVIVSDNFHPARSGSGSLYTVEHFEAVRARLARGGLFCQWLPLHQMDLETLRSIVRSFTLVNPGAFALVASNSLETPVVGLVAGADGERLDAVRLRARLGEAALPERVGRLGFEDDMAVLGSFIAGPAALQRFAGGAPVNTDDLPVVTYRAPRITYSPDSHPGDRLIALLQQVEVSPGELVVNLPDAAWEGRLVAYWRARNRFVEAGRDIVPAADARAMLSRVQAPLLAVLGISPDFRPAYDPLLSLATALVRVDRGRARALLAELARLQPARHDAAALLSQIDSASSAQLPSH